MIDENKILPALTSAQVARLLNVHINTVRRWNSRGILKAYRVGPRGDRRFKWEDVLFALQEEPKGTMGNGRKFMSTGSYNPGVSDWGAL